MEEHSAGFLSGVITVSLAIVGVASLAVVLSRNSNTAAIIQNSASGVSNALEAAEAPVTGAAERPNLSYSTGTSLSELENESGFF